MMRSGKSLPCMQTTPTHVRTLLIMDDDPASLAEVVHILQGEDYLILTADNAHSGLTQLALDRVEVILAVQHRDNPDTLAFMHTAEEIHPHTVRIMLSDNEIPGLYLAANSGTTHKSLVKPISNEHLRKHLAESFTCHAALFKTPQV